MKSVIVVIPARGGSKGIPRKNLAYVGGRPLLGWAIDVAKRCDLVSRIIVSTEDSEIARVAEKLGAEVPFIRPAELARDETPDWPVFTHAVKKLRELDGLLPDTVVWLRPTAPFRKPGDIADCVRLLHSSGANAVRSVCRVSQHPFWTVRIDGNRLSPFFNVEVTGDVFQRQKLPSVHIPNGAVDVFAVQAALEMGGLFLGDVRAIVMPEERSLDIDTEFDLALARAIVDAGLVAD